MSDSSTVGEITCVFSSDTSHVQRILERAPELLPDPTLAMSFSNNNSNVIACVCGLFLDPTEITDHKHSIACRAGLKLLLVNVKKSKRTDLISPQEMELLHSMIPLDKAQERGQLKEYMHQERCCTSAALRNGNIENNTKHTTPCINASCPVTQTQQWHQVDPNALPDNAPLRLNTETICDDCHHCLANHGRLRNPQEIYGR